MYTIMVVVEGIYVTNMSFYCYKYPLLSCLSDVFLFLPR